MTTSISTAIAKRLARRGHRGRATQAAYVARMRAIIEERKAVPCADCGGRFDTVCMDFDHRPGEVKRFSIGDGKSYGEKVLLAEIAKCDVVCANCHRLRTFRSRNHAETSHGRRASAPQLSLGIEVVA